MKAPALVLLAVLCAGCGGNPEAPAGSGSTPTAPSKPSAVSPWAGTFTGQLNFAQCPAYLTTCGGDKVTLTISAVANAAIPGEFTMSLTASGVDSTTGVTFTATGTTPWNSAAPEGPGTVGTGAYATLNTSNGWNLFLYGSGGSLSTTAPVLVDNLNVFEYKVINGVDNVAADTLGILVRQQ